MLTPENPMKRAETFLVEGSLSSRLSLRGGSEVTRGKVNPPPGLRFMKALFTAFSAAAGSMSPKMASTMFSGMANF